MKGICMENTLSVSMAFPMSPIATIQGYNRNYPLYDL
jgi:hypothetical protein